MTSPVQVLLFSAKSGTLLQQYAIGMRKVSGFTLFAIKSHRVCSFSKNGTQDAKKQKAGLIPEYPAKKQGLTQPRQAPATTKTPRQLRRPRPLTEVMKYLNRLVGHPSVTPPKRNRKQRQRKRRLRTSRKHRLSKGKGN